MSQIFFSKQDSYEKQSRLALLGSSQGVVTVGLKGVRVSITSKLEATTKNVKILSFRQGKISSK